MPVQPGSTARWPYAPQFRRAGQGYRDVVRVLEVRKHTARVECYRRNGAIVRRFIKLSRLF